MYFILNVQYKCDVSIVLETSTAGVGISFYRLYLRLEEFSAEDGERHLPILAANTLGEALTTPPRGKQNVKKYS
jgi:hypothetical protein